MVTRIEEAVRLYVTRIGGRKRGSHDQSAKARIGGHKGDSYDQSAEAGRHLGHILASLPEDALGEIARRVSPSLPDVDLEAILCGLKQTRDEALVVVAEVMEMPLSMPLREAPVPDFSLPMAA